VAPTVQLIARDAFAKSEVELDTLRSVIEHHPSFAHVAHNDALKEQALAAFFRVELDAGDEVIHQVRPPVLHLFFASLTGVMINTALFKKTGSNVFAVLLQGEQGDNFYVVNQGFCEGFIAKPSPAKTESTISSSQPAAVAQSDTSASPSSAAADRGVVHNSRGELGERIETFGPGQSFGEVSLLYNSVRGATVKAKTRTVLWAMDRASFLRFSMSASGHLERVFRKFASVKGADKQWYMTERDFFRAILPSIRRTAYLLDPSGEALERVSSLMLQLLRGASRSELLLNFSEFVHLDLLLSRPNSDTEIAFRVIDTNKDGFIQLADLQRLVTSRGRSAADLANDPATAQIFGRDRASMLSYAQFVTLLHEHALPTVAQDCIREVCSDLRLLYAQWTQTLTFEDEDVPYFDGSFHLDTGRAILPRARHVPKADDAVKCSVAGALARLSVYPLRRLQLLSQAHHGDHAHRAGGVVKGAWRNARHVVHAEGFGGLYRGVLAHSLKSFPTLFGSFVLFHQARRLYFSEAVLPFWQSFAISGAVAATVSSVAYPLTLLHTALGSHHVTPMRTGAYALGSSAAPASPFTMGALAKQIVATSGVKGLYSGFGSAGAYT